MSTSAREGDAERFGRSKPSLKSSLISRSMCIGNVCSRWREARGKSSKAERLKRHVSVVRLALRKLPPCQRQCQGLVGERAGEREVVSGRSRFRTHVLTISRI